MIRFVPCAKLKGPAAAPAKDLYVSRAFRRMRHYCELQGGPWFILSAKHGLVHPDMVLKPYDRTLGKMSKEERSDWGRMVLRQLPDMVEGYTSLELLCGVHYREPILKALQRRFGRVTIPMEGMAQGVQYQWLGERIKELCRS